RKEFSWDVKYCETQFFLSSRRRHTRFSRDWSSDVCSSDLKLAYVMAPRGPAHEAAEYLAKIVEERSGGTLQITLYPGAQLGTDRSEERRVGKGCGPRSEPVTEERPEDTERS